MSGLFGAVTKGDCAETLLYGTDYHSHLGTEIGGLATLGDHFSRVIHDISQSQFKSKFAHEYQAMPGPAGIGVISDSNPQPILISSRFGDFALVSAGLIENAQEIYRELLSQGDTFSELHRGGPNPTELLAKIIAHGRDLVDGIEYAFEKIEGSISLLALTREGIYAARDRLGRTPLLIGERQGEFAVASETCAFPNLGFKTIKILRPGEIVLLSPSGAQAHSDGNHRSQVCAFLWIYTGHPASSYEGISVEMVRNRSGRAMARRDHVQADLVAGVPDSGTGHAIGYAMESKLPYCRPLVKYTPGYGRSYTPPSQEIRDHVAKMKLIAIEEISQGQRIILCEDSIVRGTQLKNLTVQKLKGAGAQEIHIRPACPPLMFPCKFALSTRSIEELAARRAIRALEGSDLADITPYLDDSTEKYHQMVDWIAEDLGVTSLRYQTLDDMIAAIGLSRDKLCLYCWTGEE